MPAPTFRICLPLAAALSVAAASASPAFSFSRIGSDTGTGQQHEGIVAVPLPPLPNERTDAADPTADGDTPPGPAAAQNTKAPPATAPAPPPSSGGDTTLPAPPAGSGEPRSPDADPSRAAPAQATDPNSTDEGEVPADIGDGDTGDAGGATPAPGQPADNGAAPSAGEASDPVGPDGKVTGGDTEKPVPPAEIVYGDKDLPPPVRDLREKLMAIARTGNIEALRPYIEGGEDGTVLTFAGQDGDPIDYLKSASGDGEGVEILAILLELLQAGHVRSDPATDDETYVWPYFTGVPVDKLTKPQKVELFELVTAGDYQEMVNFGAYNFYRVGISPDGKLQFFVAGD